MIYRVGPHVVRHGDIMDDLDGFYPSGGIDYVYTDPPWGGANLKYWSTICRRDCGGVVTRVPEFSQFLDRLFEVIDDATHQDSVIFMEYGLRWRNLIEFEINRFGFTLNSISVPRYGNRNLPLNLFVFSRNTMTLPTEYTEAINGTKGMNTLYAATSCFRMDGARVLDPFCGLGNTARLCVQRGAIFYGNEINLKRLNKTIHILEMSGYASVSKQERSGSSD